MSTITMQRRGRAVTHKEAEEAAQRLSCAAWGDNHAAQLSVPLRVSDDDVLITDYVAQQAMTDEQKVRSIRPNAQCRGYLHLYIQDGDSRWLSDIMKRGSWNEREADAWKDAARKLGF